MKTAYMLMTTTFLALASSYMVHLLHPNRYNYRSKPSPSDCSAYATGSGLGEDGEPFQDFWSFYPYYLCEHRKPATKLFHFVATTNYLALITYQIANGFQPSLLILGLVQGYGLAWISHFFIEVNKPATWQYPKYSFMADHVLYKEVLQGQHSLW